ncbi:MAG: hypothetical protein EG823_05580 [Actinobacteria bacterium]|nr:hypothetical protein [Actinomycetota bacterium]
MRYDAENARIELSAAELAGAVSGLELQLGPVAPGRLGGGGADALRAFEDGLASLPSAARDLLAANLERLADPARALKIAAAAGDAWLHRAVYAFDGTGVSVLASALDSNFLASSSAADIAAVFSAALVGEPPVIDSDTRLVLEGRDVVTLVAAADALRYGRLAALSAHKQYPEGLVSSEIAARLAESMIDDPRWSSNLLASVLPFDASAFMDTPTVELAMARLAEVGLFAVTERDGALPAIYHPTDAGLVTLHAIAEAGGRVAFTLFEKRQDALAYESVLLARGRGMLLMLNVAPEGGGMAPLSSGALAQLIARVSEA